MSALTPIDFVIRQACIEAGDKQFKNYDDTLMYARNAINDLCIYVFPSVVAEFVPVNTLGNINWPNDCILPIQVKLTREGKQYKFNHEVAFDFQQNCGCDGVTKEIPICDGFVTHNYDNRTTHINFKPKKGDKFLLVYNSSKSSEGVEFVPVEAEMAIIEFCLWKLLRRKDKGTSRDARIQYEREAYRLRALYQDRTLEEWIDAVIPK
jgi:hypothetical protein